MASKRLSPSFIYNLCSIVFFFHLIHYTVFCVYVRSEMVNFIPIYRYFGINDVTKIPIYRYIGSKELNERISRSKNLITNN